MYQPGTDKNKDCFLFSFLDFLISCSNNKLVRGEEILLIIKTRNLSSMG